MAQLLWTQKQDVGPSARSDVAMVFDAARSRVVLFGGAGGSTATLFNDTWEWDGENWTQYEDIGPVPRSRHGMAYDSKRGRTVLFGGSAGNVNLNDTWEWDGQDWTQVADTGPPARGGHAMAYDDSLRGRVILFGGDVGQSSFGDTWAWDGANWTQEADTGPPARTGHGMDYDNLRDRVVLVDGIGKSTVQVQVSEWVKDNWWGGGHYEYHSQQQVKVQFFNDTWEYNGSVWTRVADTGPEPRTWSTTEKPCSSSAARIMALSLRIRGSGMENIGRSVKISVRLLERSPRWPTTARASAQCYLVAPDQAFLATLGSSFSKLEVSKPARNRSSTISKVSSFPQGSRHSPKIDIDVRTLVLASSYRRWSAFWASAFDF